jgi:hypothetical protein
MILQRRQNLNRVTWMVGLALVAVPLDGLAEISRDLVVRYLLATVQAFRTVYVERVMERVKPMGIEPKEDWMKDDHAIMLPFQFVKVAGQEMKALVKDVEVGLELSENRSGSRRAETVDGGAVAQSRDLRGRQGLQGHRRRLCDRTELCRVPQSSPEQSAA